jgi:hypothetical protein
MLFIAQTFCSTGETIVTSKRLENPEKRFGSGFS